MVNGRRGTRGILVSKPAALLFGGPREGWSYFVSDLQSLIRLEREFNGREFWYAPSGVMVDHPRTFGEVQSERWDYIEELDPFRPQPPPPPTKLELVHAAIALCGRQGGRLPDIVNNLPPDMVEGLLRNNLAVCIAPLVWWLTRLGTVEHSEKDHPLDRRYRTVLNA